MRATVVLVGHSFGGYTAIERAKWFTSQVPKEQASWKQRGKTFSADIHLITIDAIIPGTGKYQTSPTPVTVGPTGLSSFVNYYQISDVRPSPIVKIYGASITNAENNLIPNGDHTEIDNDLAPEVSKQIQRIIGE